MAVGMIGAGFGHTRTTGRRTVPQANPQNDLLIDTAKHADIVRLAERFTTLRRESAHEWSGPCPHCGGDDRFHCTAEWWNCRQCHDKRSDAIEFVQWATGMDFKQAVGYLAGGTMLPNTTQPVQQRAERPAPVQTDDWQIEAGKDADTAHQRLLNADDAQPQRDYLQQRGLSLDTWVAYRLGAGEAWSRDAQATLPAVVMPWYRGGKVRALRFRFLAPAGKQKTTSKPGSLFGGTLFGGQALPGAEEGPRCLVLCEGELNAASIWQVAHQAAVDVLSMGSESASLSDAMIAHAAKYRHVIVWMDKPEVVERVKAKVAGAVGFASPQGQDANDCLRAGTLQAMIAELRRRTCRNDVEREGLLWDMWDQHNLYGGVDAPTQVIIAELRKELGK